jgi:thiamine biosynthesis protein ThiS
MRRLNYLLKIKKKMTKIKKFYVNGQHYYTYQNITLLNVITYFSYDDSLLVLEYNNVISSKKNWENIFIVDQDKLEVVSIVGGG